ncbi:MAG: HNH endonuclease [Pseudomonadota bacterium]
MFNGKPKRVAHQASVGNSTVRSLLRLVGQKYDESRGFDRFGKNLKSDMDRIVTFFDGNCCYCGEVLSSANLEKDHLIPINMDQCGLHAWGNVVPCCAKCNDEKHGTPWEVYCKGVERRYVERIIQFRIHYKYDFDSAKLAAVTKRLHREIGEEMAHRVWQSLNQIMS